MDRRRQIGEIGEEHVCRLLGARGWRVIARNARTRYGEIDLIVISPARVLAFVEVKSRRRSSSAGPVTPAGSVGPGKARRIRRLAAAWLQLNPGLGAAQIRFDVAGVEVEADGSARVVQYIEAAF